MTKSLHSKAYSEFLAVLVATRHNKSLTQQNVADRLHKPQSYIAKIERGERRLDIIEFIALAKAMNADPVKLFKTFVKMSGR